nr:hypothetical protein [Tanacetum cinerariifolium]
MQSKEGNIDSSKALDADLVATEINGTESEKHDTSSRFGSDTHAEDADIKPMNDKEPMVKVQLTAQNNVLANEQQHSMQSEPIYDTYLLEKFSLDNDEGLMISKYFIAYTKTDVLLFHATLIQHMESLRESILERAKHKREYESRMNERQMQSKEGNIDSSKALDADLVATEINGTESEKHDTSSRFGSDTHAEDADIKPMNDKEPMVKVQLTAQNNVLANEQQHSMQSEPIYDTYLLEKVDSNITPDSTNMSHKGGDIDKNAEKC